MAASWVDRVAAEMVNLTQGALEKKTGKTAQIFNYRLEHVEAVVKLAVKLAEELDADPDVVLAAAWLHDIAKTSSGDKPDRSHELEGARLARKLLAETDFPPEKIDAVYDAICKHKGLYKDHKIEPLEAAILWDADKLSKLGATSIAHFLAKPGNTTQGTLQQNLKWFEVMDKIVSSMNTEPAVRMARKRAKIFKEFFYQLEKELEAKE